MRTYPSLFRRGPAVALVVASLALAACGDDDESSSDGGGSADSGTPQTLTITQSGTEKDLKTEITPKTVKPGAVKIVVENALEDKGSGDAQMAYVEGDHSEKEILAEFDNAVKGKAVAEWFIAAGGPCCADKKGATATTTQELKEGTYYLLPGDKAKSPLPKFEVKGEEGAAFEPPTAKVTATEYSFSGEGVKSGEPLLLENGGGTWHHFLASKLKPGATIAQAKKFLQTEKGEPPFEGQSNAVETTVIDSGLSQIEEFKGEPGKYAFFCFIPDKQKGGPPHVAKGMVSEVVVE